MKMFLAIGLTVVYMLVASVTYNVDRGRGRAHCWEQENLNEPRSSAISAGMWPLYVFLAGVWAVMVAEPDGKICTSKNFKAARS